MSVVSNSSPLINLATIPSFDLLRLLYCTIDIPQAVYHEVVTLGAGRPGSQEVATSTWIHRHTVRQKRAVTQLMTIVGLDRGESEAIVLAQKLRSQLIILDDKGARNYAQQNQLTLTGTAGVLLAAKQRGIIPLVRPLLDALLAANVYLDATVYQAALHLAGE